MNNGLWTVKFNDESITGKVYGGFGVSRPYKKVYMGEIRYGKQEGRWKYYYHSTGKKEFDFNFKNGKRYGLNTDWYENGQKENEVTYKYGEIVKVIGMWNKNGSVKW